MVEENVRMYQDNSAFYKYREKIIFDCACFNIVSDHQVILKNSNIIIDFNNLQSKAIFIANYVFDSLPVEMIKVQDSKLYAGYVTLIEKVSSCGLLKKSQNNKKIKNITNIINYKLISQEEEILSSRDLQIINQYKEKYKLLYIEYPIIITKFLEKIKCSKEQDRLIISSDYGHVSLKDSDYLEDLSLSIHDNCFSTAVNYDSVIKYFEALGGKAYVLEADEAFVTMFFLSGKNLHDLPRLEHFVISKIVPSPYTCNMLRPDTCNMLRPVTDNFSLWVKLYNYDPSCVIYYPFIFIKLLKSKQELSKDVIEKLGLILENIFFVEYNFHSLLAGAVISFILKRYQESIEYFEKIKREDLVKISSCYYKIKIEAYKKVHAKRNYLFSWYQYFKLFYKNMARRLLPFGILIFCLLYVYVK